MHCEAPQPLVDADRRSPIQGLPRLALVEPMRGGQLLGQESRHRRFVLARPERPCPLDQRPRRARDTRGDAPPRRLHTRGQADPRKQFADGPRFAVRDHERTTVRGIGSVQRRDDARQHVAAARCGQPTASPSHDRARSVRLRPWSARTLRAHRPATQARPPPRRARNPHAPRTATTPARSGTLRRAQTRRATPAFPRR